MKNKRLGIGLIVFGVVGALILLMIGNRVSSSAIKHFGRVNVGCQVTFTFPSAGTYFVFIEQGKPRQHNNGCEPSTRGDELSVVITRDGAPVELTPDVSVTYDADGVTGESQSRFEVEADSRFQVTVTGPESTPSVAMGIDPATARRPWRLAAGFVGALGVIGGSVVLANRRRAQEAVRDGDEIPVAPLAPPTRQPSTQQTAVPQPSADITSPTGITVRQPAARSAAASPPRDDKPSTVQPRSKPPYLPASAVAAVEARRRSTTVPAAAARDQAPSNRRSDDQHERTKNTVESPIVPAQRAQPPTTSDGGKAGVPAKPAKRGAAVVSSGSSRRRSGSGELAGAPDAGPARTRPPQPSQPTGPAQPSDNSPTPARAVPPNTVPNEAVSATPPGGVETVGDVLGDLSGSTPPSGAPRQPRPAAVQKAQRQRPPASVDPGPQRSAGRRASTKPNAGDRSRAKPASTKRRPQSGGTPLGETRRRPVVGDFLDEMTVGDVLDDSAGFVDLPPSRRRRPVGETEASSMPPRGRRRRPSMPRRYDELDDGYYEPEEFDYRGRADSEYGIYVDDGYERGGRGGYDDSGDREGRGRSRGRNQPRSRSSRRARPDRGPEPMREWGTERLPGDDDTYPNYDDDPASSKTAVPPPPPPIRMPPPLPEPDSADSANGDRQASVEDEWHDAGDDTGAWRWWSPPDPRNRR